MFIDKEGNVRKPVVYLADFEMFLPSCPETVEYWKKTCDKYGLIGLFPGDRDVLVYLPGQKPVRCSADKRVRFTDVLRGKLVRMLGEENVKG